MGKLGYSTLTLTDLTETLPVSLVLESNLSQNIQTKTGNLYTPNLSQEGEELIITPSLFIGTEEIKPIPVKKSEEQDSNYIYYQTGDIGEDGVEINYTDSSTQNDGVWVDNEGRLHYNKNLNRNITIEAYINNFKNEKHNYTIELVKTTNPINILFLEEGDNNYNVVINSGGREHFEEGKAAPIELTATLYHGITPITEGISYKWDIVTDKDTEEKDDDLNWSEDQIGTDFVSVEPSIIVERNKVSSVEVFSCTITVNKTGLSYTGTKILRDFTDGYTNQLIADKSLILTPNNTTVTLTNQVWYQANIINKDKYEDNNLTEEQIKENESNHNRFFYKWSLLTKDTEEIILSLGSGKEYKDYTIDLNSSFQKLDGTGKALVDETGKPIKGNFPKENFSILGMVTIDGKAVTLNYADIKYQPIPYTVNISPKTIFVPATNDGAYKEEEGAFIQKIKFQLLDDNKQPLKYDINDSGPVSLNNNNDNSKIKISRKDESIWDFDIDFILDTTTSNNLWNEKKEKSKTYQFTYEYLDNPITETFEVVKNYAGANGNPGEPGNPGYTVDLSNSFHAFAGGEAIATPGEETSFEISAFYGDKALTIEKVYLENDSNQTNLIDEKEYKNIKGFEIEGSRINEKVKIKLTTGSNGNFLEEGGTLGLNIVINNNGETFTFYKTFNYIINYNGKSYYLSYSANTVTYSNSTGLYDPDSIVIKAYSREVNGAASEYSEGAILYSFDGENWNILKDNVLKLSEDLLIKNIYVRLYSAKANITGSIPSDLDSKYILDEELLRVLISLDGVFIGGENLLPRTQDLPLAAEGEEIDENDNTDVWIKDENNNLYRQEEGEDFFSMSFNFSDLTSNTDYSFYSPKIKIYEDFFNNTFCFSSLIYCDNWSTLKEDCFYFLVEGFKEESNSRQCYLRIGDIYANNSSMIFENGRSSGKWVKIYKNFKLDSFENCDELRIRFALQKNGILKIKKPKLEIGTIPTDWSSKPSDLLFAKLQGLGGNKLKEELKKFVDKSKVDRSIEEALGELVIETPEGLKSFDTVAALEQFLNNEIGKVNTRVGEQETVLDSYVKTLEEHEGVVTQVDSHIKIGFEDEKNKQRPFIKLNVNAVDETTQLKITDTKIEFKMNDSTKTTLSNEYLDTNKIRACAGVYIGEKDYEKGETPEKDTGTGYLVIATTEQGVGFKWMDSFIGG